MELTQYAEVWRAPHVRGTLLVGLLTRIPLWAGQIVLTLHVVGHLNRSYTAAGVVVAAATIAVAISGPWRGRRLDRLGLRRAVWPSLVVLALCWSVAPFVGYWPLVGLVFVAGLFNVPSFSILRQVLISQVPEDRRKTALVLDSVFVEISFMLGPILGVLLAQWLSTPWALLSAEALSLAGATWLWWLNPPMGQDEEQRSQRHPVRSWLSPAVLAILAASAAAVLVLTGTDLSIVAALRALHAPQLIGWMLAAWGLGSALGGLWYGAARRQPSMAMLLGLLGGSTALVGFAPGLSTFAIGLFVCGLFCAPSMTAALDALTRNVPTAVRGEAMGWHASSLTGASALGAPLVGLALDRAGWPAGFWASGAVGVLIAAAGFLVAPRARARTQAGSRPDSDLDATPQSPEPRALGLE